MIPMQNTLSWTNMIPTPKATNEFGQPLLDDYGQDDLTPYMDDFDHALGNETALDHQIDVLLGEDVRTSTPVQKRTQIVAVLHEGMPAKVTATQVAPEPDFIDADMAWWIGESAAVGCPVGMAQHIVGIAERGGWQARVGNYPTELGVVVMPHGDLPASPVSRNAEQHSLWSLVRETVMVDA